MRTRGLICGILAAMLLCSGCKTIIQTPTPTPQAQPETAYVPEFSIGVTAGADSLFAQLLKQAAKETERSESPENALHVSFYDTTQLGTSKDILAGMKLGTVSMIACDAAEFSLQHPEWSIFTLPGLHTDVSAFNDWYKGFHDRLNAYYEEKEFHVLGVFAVSEMFLCAKMPVENPADIRSSTIAIAENEYEQIYWRSQGLQTSSFDPADSIAARQNRSVDLIAVTPHAYREQQLKMNFPYITPDKTRQSCMLLAINNAEWEALTNKQRSVIETYVARVYELIGTSQQSNPLETLAENYDWMICTPSYELREMLLDKDAAVEAYRTRLGSEYVDALFESISRYRNRYPVG